MAAGDSLSVCFLTQPRRRGGAVVSVALHVTRPRGFDSGPRVSHGAKRILVAVSNKGVTPPCLLFIEVALAE